MKTGTPITIKELCDYLIAHYPPDLRVLVAGYESGYEEPLFVTKQVVDVGRVDWYIGQYEEYSPAHHEKLTPFPAVIIDRPDGLDG